VLIGSQGVVGAFVLEHFGIRLVFTWQAAVIAAAVVAFPLVFKAARAAFENVEPQLEDAARTLGIGEWGVFFRVSLPLAWRGILAGLLLSFARALGEFGATLMVAGSIVGQTQTLSIAVYEAVQAGQDATAHFLVAVTSLTCLAVLLSVGRLAPGRVAARG
jgi:molybdate transport system permease protein